MGANKNEVFSAEQNRLAEIAKAMAHPARIAILQLLATRKSCVCGDIVDELPLSQATVSQHLKALKEAGIIKGQISGPKVCYCLCDAVCTEASLALGGFLGKMKFNCC